MAKWREKLDEFSSTSPEGGFVSFGRNELPKPPASKIKHGKELESFVSFGGFVSNVSCQSKFACQDTIYLSPNVHGKEEIPPSAEVPAQIIAYENAADETAKTDETPLRSPNPWLALASSTLTDLDVLDLDEAIFLFALRMVQKASVAELAGIEERHIRSWKRRLPDEAFHIVMQAYRSRMGSCAIVHEKP